MGQKGFDLSAAPLTGAPFLVKQDVTLNPGDVGLLGADRAVFQSYGVTDPIEQFLGRSSIRPLD